jgi:hypothetical protein
METQMTDTPEDWVLIEAAKRGSWHWIGLSINELRGQYINGDRDDLFRALCDMIAKHEQKPVDRKLLCAWKAHREWDGTQGTVEWVGRRAIELYLEGYGE